MLVLDDCIAIEILTSEFECVVSHEDKLVAFFDGHDQFFILEILLPSFNIRRENEILEEGDSNTLADIDEGKAFNVAGFVSRREPLKLCSFIWSHLQIALGRPVLIAVSDLFELVNEHTFFVDVLKGHCVADR